MIINNKQRKAFTMIELVFVIVIMSILAKFGVEYLAQAYQSFINSKVNNELQSNSSSAVKYVSNKLQYRIKESIIARETNATFTPLKDYAGGTAPFLEWIGADIEGFRGDTLPYWSGVMDLNASSGTQLISPATDTTEVNALITTLSNTATTIDDAAIFFVGSSLGGLTDEWGWNGAITDQNQTMHPVEDNATLITALKPSVGTFSGTTAFEFYQLAWSAYTVGIDDYNTTAMGGNNTGTLTLWYDYQPWRGHRYTDNAGTPGPAGHITKSVAIMQNVSSFRFISVDSLVKIQICVKSLLLQDEEYSICKEKTVF